MLLIDAVCDILVQNKVLAIRGSIAEMGFKGPNSVFLLE